MGPKYVPGGYDISPKNTALTDILSCYFFNTTEGHGENVIIFRWGAGAGGVELTQKMSESNERLLENAGICVISKPD